MNQVQLFIRALVTNSEFRRRALANPDAALDAYHLTAIEKQSLTNLCFRLSSSGGVAVDAIQPGLRPMNFWA